MYLQKARFSASSLSVPRRDLVIARPVAPGDPWPYDGAADTTIKVSWEDWQSMAAGQLDGMTAFMTGKLRIEGDMSNAMQLQGVLAKLRG